MTKLRTEVREVSPQLAEAWLRLNAQNRSITAARVDQYARDMKDGRWTLTHQAIGFDENGDLIDGQHRLAAVVQADVTVPMLVVWGMAKDSKANVDTGRARTAGDMLSILDGVSNPHVVASIAAFAVPWSLGRRIFHTYRPTHQEIREFVADPKNAQIFRAKEVAGHARTHLAGMVGPRLIGFTYLTCARIDEDAADHFFVDQLIDQLGLQADDPAKVLYRRLFNDQEKRGGGADNAKAGLIFTAWNKFRDGEKINYLRVPAEGWTESNFPVPR